MQLHDGELQACNRGVGSSCPHLQAEFLVTGRSSRTSCCSRRSSVRGALVELVGLEDPQRQAVRNLGRAGGDLAVGTWDLGSSGRCGGGERGKTGRSVATAFFFLGVVNSESAKN